MPRERRPHPRPPRPPRGRDRRPAAPTSWDPLATWYNGWVGESGSEHHREVAIPATLRLLEPQPGERILDIGAGQGVLAPAIARAGAQYIGVDASPRLLDLARKHHGRSGRFIVGDARKLPSIDELQAASFDAVVFLLSIQDMDPLDPVLAGAAWALKPGGRIVLMMTHPAFRIPRQSGWGWDEGRKLVYRRIDRYLTPLPVPMKALPGRGNPATTRSFHRPLSDYVNGLAEHGLLVDRMDEIPAHKLSGASESAKAQDLARREIPLFLGLRARTPE
ncbi:MAG TPA: class I SAM-dependent methyltransferase [Chloroflexota bacterium]